MRHANAVATGIVAAVLLLHGDTHAEDAGAPDGGEPRAKAVAVIRTPSSTRSITRSITVGELEDRIAAMPGFQRATFGATADAIRRNVLDKVLVPDALFSIAASTDASTDADAAAVSSDPAVAHAVDRALSTATVRAIRGALGSPASTPMADVQAYYDRNRARYDAPERYRVWRILCATRDEAQSVLDSALADPTPKNFGQLARDHSQDKATSMRSGNLGFLNAEGESTEPGLRVDPAVVRAAQAVRDGDLVRAPVAEGTFFSVVWRRGTLAAQKRPIEQVADSIREILWRSRVKDETDKLVASLRAAKVRDLHEELLDILDAPDLNPAPDAH